MTEDQGQTPHPDHEQRQQQLDDVSRVVLDAARAAYSRRGYVGTTLKGVAAAAGVAPDVMSRYYRNREQLFAAAMRLPFDPATSVAQLLAPGIDGMGERLVRITLRMLDDPETRDQLAEMVRDGAGASKATASLREFLESAVVDRVVGVLGVPDARMRVSLATSYLVGVAASRYVLQIEPLASATEDEIVALVAPAIQAALTTPTQPTKAQREKG
ncbi:MAG: TetR family transcriptional regulator [Actinobacteria bacterium]|jgi:AcrR family transcriptional regulator|nr:TetR family transcriptional regulator [Actinomycetota bacterium]